MSPLSDRETARQSRNEAAREYLDAGAGERLRRWIEFARVVCVPLSDRPATTETRSAS